MFDIKDQETNLANVKDVDVGFIDIKDQKARPTKYDYEVNENTLLYIPMNSESRNADLWPNSRWTSTWWTVRFWTYWGVDCMDITSMWYININSFTVPIAYTCLMWLYNVNNYRSSDGDWKIFDFRNWNPPCTVAILWSQWYKFNTGNDVVVRWSKDMNKRLLMALTVDWDTCDWYLKWAWINDHVSWTWSPVRWINSWAFCLWDEYNHWVTRFFLWYLSRFIMEKKRRSSTEIDDYFNKIKSLYWIS